MGYNCDVTTVTKRLRDKFSSFLFMLLSIRKLCRIMLNNVLLISSHDFTKFTIKAKLSLTISKEFSDYHIIHILYNWSDNRVLIQNLNFMQPSAVGGASLA
uniref:Uncharacterized protein n=1 Tax=Rhizophagus irregularis (strain DAOM 181602 / DAOM 197198 / MUCL 43194) TaxID=747089 RepID=U9T344_RHIID